MELKGKGLFASFRSLTPNGRACIWTEPLWGIPFNLAAAFASPYMEALGLTKLEIGAVGSLMLIVSVVSAMLSGVITDKLGRRWTTFYFDMLAWTIPELLWAFSRDFKWFLVAAMFNGLWRITANSWSLLLVEDNEDEMVLRANSLAQMMGLMSVFLAPVSGLCVSAFGVVPTMRVMYVVGCAMMTLKFVLMLVYSRETSVGVLRMSETKGRSIWSLLWDCRKVYAHLLTEKRILLTMALIAVFQIVSRLNETFWSLYVINSIGITGGNVIYFSALKSLITILSIIFVVPRILRISEFKRPTLMAFCVFLLSQALLIVAPRGGLGAAVLMLSAVCEGVALSIISPVVDSMLVIHADPRRRARIYGLVYATILLPVSLFPMLGGWLDAFTNRAPFLINMLMLSLGLLLTLALARCRADASGEVSA